MRFGVPGRSSAMQDVLGKAELLAPSNATVLIVGERGTGKEMLARAIHAASARAAAPFVVLDCSATPPSLADAVLVGYAKGVFPDAAVSSPGAIEQAHRGTLFVREIASLRRAAQAKLARVLDAHVVRRVGEARERPVDVRLIASTHGDLPSLVHHGLFRSELHDHLNPCVLEVPPLRDRVDDVPLLVEQLLPPGTRVSAAALDAVRAYPWPGNVRELRGALERAALLAQGDVVDVAALPREVVAWEVAPRSEASVDLASLTYREALDRVRTDGVRRYLEALLERFGGSVTAAAEHAELERESFYRLCRRHAVNPANFRDGSAPKSRR